MTENLSAAAIGYALVDYKQRASYELPRSDDATRSYIQEHNEGLHVCAGGSVSNTMVAYGRYSGLPTRLFYAIGSDAIGSLYYEQTGEQFGAPQLIEDQDTGYCLLNIDNDGMIFDEVTLPQAAAAVSVNQTELHETNRGLVVSNVNTLRNERVREQTAMLVRGLNKARGIFALRLSGSHSFLSTPSEANNVIDNLPGAPYITFGNDSEIVNLTGNHDIRTAMEEVLPDSRVMIVTQGDKDVLVRFEGEFYSLSPDLVSDVIDVSGAGDHFMGVTMAELMRFHPSEWSAKLVLSAACKGNRAAAMVLGTMQSRLTNENLNSIRRHSYDVK